jgi:CHAT domain-containing protein
LNEYIINYSLSSSEIKRKPTERSSEKELLGIGYSGGVPSQTRSNYGSLVGTEDEIKHLMTRIEGDFFLGLDGSKGRFLESAKDYDILHLAVHGEADNNDRYQSNLIFSGDGNNILKTSDLYVAGLKARLAVLSACESGVGEINRGEGTFSIARGFALVGVPSIVMSLWKVNDKEAAKLISKMYENFLEGQSIDSALSMAKRDYVNNSEQFTSHILLVGFCFFR